MPGLCYLRRGSEAHEQCGVAVTAGVTVASQGRDAAPLNWLRKGNLALFRGHGNHSSQERRTMCATHQRLAGLAALTALALACNPDQGPVEPMAPTFDRLSQSSSAPPRHHILAPQATEPAIDQARDDLY